MARRRRSVWPCGSYWQSVTDLEVRFAEVDSMDVVWHGHYVNYFEQGRVHLGRQLGIGYEDIRHAGLSAPIVQLDYQLYAPARFGDRLQIVTRLYPEEAAKLIFWFQVLERPAGRVLAMGHSVQVLTDFEGRLILTRPPLLSECLDRHGDALEECS